jgi:hypothetical protein
VEHCFRTNKTTCCLRSQTLTLICSSWPKTHVREIIEVAASATVTPREHLCRSACSPKVEHVTVERPRGDALSGPRPFLYRLTSATPEPRRQVMTMSASNSSHNRHLPRARHQGRWRIRHSGHCKTSFRSPVSRMTADPGRWCPSRYERGKSHPFT